MAKKNLELVIGGKTYTGRSTLGLYSRAGEATGFDISEMFNAVLPPRAFYVSLAAEVSGMCVEQVENELFMSEYTDLCTAIVLGVLPDADPDASKDDEAKNPTPPETIIP